MSNTPLTRRERLFHNSLRQVRNFCQSREVVYGHSLASKSHNRPWDHPGLSSAQQLSAKSDWPQEQLPSWTHRRHAATVNPGSKKPCVPPPAVGLTNDHPALAHIDRSSPDHLTAASNQPTSHLPGDHQNARTLNPSARSTRAKHYPYPPSPASATTFTALDLGVRVTMGCLCRMPMPALINATLPC